MLHTLTIELGVLTDRADGGVVRYTNEWLQHLVRGLEDINFYGFGGFISRFYMQWCSG